MGKKLMGWKTKGMNQDLSVSAFNPEFSFENMNLRLATNEGNTLMSWVNEKGTKEMALNIILSPWETSQGTEEVVTSSDIEGTPIGTAVINNYFIVFTHQHNPNTDPVDRIYRFEKSTTTNIDLEGVLIYKNDLGFDLHHPLETLVSYEAEDVQKVYWVDGKNQPRMINVAADTNTINKWHTNNNYKCFFDFVPELQLEEEVYVKKLLGVAGMFAPGVIQYACTYYNKNAQESHIFYTSPLLYISHRDRGAAQDDKVENAFRITVKNVDMHFDYLRIYSIHRTSINATPECKRIQDIKLSDLEYISNVGYVASYIDNGMSGDIVDPTELLYKGGEVIIANSITQKDNTIFFGGIETKDTINEVENIVKDSVTVAPFTTRDIYPEIISTGDYSYANQLTATTLNGERTVPCGGFKRGDYYRCGVQLQDKYGRWSKPIWKSIWDVRITSKPTDNTTHIVVPTIQGSYNISSSNASIMGTSGYKKIRPIVVFPNLLDRVVLCQGVVCPTMFTTNHRDVNKDNDLYAQSSWFFRGSGTNQSGSGGAMRPKSPGNGTTYLDYTSRATFGNNPYNPESIKYAEIWGDYDDNNKFQIGKYTPNDVLTFHSPDIEFDTQLSNASFIDTKYLKIGKVTFSHTLSDIDIQTETPTISNTGSGFVHKSFSCVGMYGIISGLFYDDFAVDDDKDDKSIKKQRYQKCPCKWMVHAWHKTGSLNNDINRPADKGVATAKLKKKIISNLRYAVTDLDDIDPTDSWSGNNFQTPQLFDSDQNTIVKINGHIYRGNIDTALMPDHPDGMYFAFNDSDDPQPLTHNTLMGKNVTTSFTDAVKWKTYSVSDDEDTRDGYYYKYNNNSWSIANRGMGPGEVYIDLVVKKDIVRMKYKSTPHLVLEGTTNLAEATQDSLSIVEILNPTNDKRFGGTSGDALRENDWLPCGEPVSIVRGSTTFEYSYGDTYFQRWDCLKTYPFTKEDENQIVEIGSFMLETRVNIDGRYDRNRGQASNLNMSPVNFNLLNPVYSQKDNFFTYKIMDDDYYKQHSFPNQLTWSIPKESGADVDAWTNLTLASILEMDGDKGKITKLTRLNDQLICFQDSGISQILYNENAQISTAAGVPIELANSGKVQGKRYLSDTVGCSNKWSVVNTPGGIYFMDSNEKSIYMLGDGLKNLSQHLGFSSWCKQHIPSPEIVWNPENFGDNNGTGAFVSYYDNQNQEVLFINKEIALAFSEKLSAFTSFYSYGNAQFFNTLKDKRLWLKTDSAGTLMWEHQAGDYCRFFGYNQPYWMTLVGNPEPQADKTFTNIEFRATVAGEGEINEQTKFIHTLPFDGLEVWNEHQHGYADLSMKNGHGAGLHHLSDMSASLNRKFRIWRCDIPRNNCLLDNDPERGMPPYSTDSNLGVSRFYRKPNDRMRNPWVYLKLFKRAAQDESTEVEGETQTILHNLPKTEVHDVVMTYFV